MPKRWCQCRGCQACASPDRKPGNHNKLYNAGATGTLKCPGCQDVATAKRNARPNTASRGYGRTHQNERERWAAVIERGDGRCMETVCLEVSRYIPPGTPWDLAHNETRTGWLGPAHQRCNRATNKG